MKWQNTKSTKQKKHGRIKGKLMAERKRRTGHDCLKSGNTSQTSFKKDMASCRCSWSCWCTRFFYSQTGRGETRTVRDETERPAKRSKQSLREIGRERWQSIEVKLQVPRSWYKVMQLIMMNPGSLWVISCFLESRWSWTVHKNALAAGIQSIRVNIYLHTSLCECMTWEGKCVFL